MQLAISDAHPGLKAALAQVLGARGSAAPCTSSATLRGHARKDQHDALGAVIRQIFTAELRRGGPPAPGRGHQPAASAALPKVAAMLEEAEEDILAFYAFPQSTGRSSARTNPLERFNREIGRRTDVVGIFPDDAS